MAADAGGPVVFETETRIDLVPGTIAALRGVDAGADAITKPSGAVMAAKLPRVAPPTRRLRSGAAAGATKIQIDPAAGLEPGMLLRLGEGEAALHYLATAVEGDLVTIEPALEAPLPANAPASEVTDFAPFATGTRNYQSHALYLGHATMLDVPSAVTITITGTQLPAETVWSWWGSLGDDDPPAWHALTKGPGPGLNLTKQVGKPAKTVIRGRKSLWLRAEVPGKSAASAHGQDVRIAIGGSLCSTDRDRRCIDNLEAMNVAFEAIANATPVVTNSPFHPFGQEPRLYDSFYIGSDEAFSKAGAEVSLCFRLAGPELGPMAGIKESDATRVFAVGTDGLLYRAQLTPTMVLTTLQTSAELRPVPSPSNDGRTVLLQGRSPVALWKDGITKFVAAAGAGAIHVAKLPDGANLAAVEWYRLPLEATAKVDALAVHSGVTGFDLYALVGTELFIWRNVGAGVAPVKHGATVRHLMQIEPSDPLTGIERGADGRGGRQRPAQAGPAWRRRQIVRVVPSEPPADDAAPCLRRQSRGHDDPVRRRLRQVRIAMGAPARRDRRRGRQPPRPGQDGDDADPGRRAERAAPRGRLFARPADRAHGAALDQGAAHAQRRRQ